jgi:hypothetical protein
VCGVIVLFTAGSFTGMTGDTIIGIKIKTVLFVTIWILTDGAIIIYI